MNSKAKGRIYKAVVRPALIYGSETWAVKKSQEKRMDVAEMRMLRWMLGKTKRDRIRNERIREMAGVAECSKKVQERRLQWYGHVVRREDDYVGKRVSRMQVEGCRPVGRPRRRWRDCVAGDMREKELTDEEAGERMVWRRKIRNSDPE